MRLNKVKALCKERKTALLLNETSEDGELRRQWLSDGAAMWLITGMPTLGAENLPTLLGLEGKQVESMRISQKEFPVVYSTEDKLYADATLGETAISLIILGEEWLVMGGAGGAWLIPEKELRPIRTEQCSMALRRTEGGTPYAAVFDGLFLAGIIITGQSTMLNGSSRDILRKLLAE